MAELGTAKSVHPAHAGQFARQGELDLNRDLSIARLTPADVLGLSDHFLKFRELVLSNAEMYPGIEDWFADKVIPGACAGRRALFIAYHDEMPIASAVVKAESDAKFCHLRIAEEFQDAHIGELFFSLMAAEVRHVARRVYFTLPESLWANKSGFFASFGFQAATLSSQQYDRPQTELRCDAAFHDVWRAVGEKLPKLLSSFTVDGRSHDAALLMSIRPRHVDSIFSGTKTVEIRRKFSTKWQDHWVSLYATTPASELVGRAKIARVLHASPDAIWLEHGGAIGCGRAEFDEYTRGAETVYAIVLEDVSPFASRVSLDEARALTSPDLSVPQSYSVLGAANRWTSVVALASIMKQRFSYGL